MYEVETSLAIILLKVSPGVINFLTIINYHANNNPNKEAVIRKNP